MLFNFDFFDLFGKTKRKTRYEKTREAGPRYPGREWTTSSVTSVSSSFTSYSSDSSYSDSSSFSSCDTGGGGCD